MCRKLIYLISLVLVLCLVLTNPASAVDPNLIGWWKLDDANGLTFVDSSSYGHNGTITDPNINPVTWTDNGYEGRALEFTSVTDEEEPYEFTLCAAPLTSGLLNINNATYSFWIKMPVSHAAWGPILVVIGDVHDSDVEPDSSGRLWVGSMGLSDWYWWGGKDPKVNDNQWHHVAVTFSGPSDANVAILYVDGVEIANTRAGYQDSAGGTGWPHSDNMTTARLGGPRWRNTWRSYGGLLDEVAVFNRALSDAEVRNLFWYGAEWSLFATNPNPADKAKVGTADVMLSWTPGEKAASVDGHRVYFDLDKQKVIGRSGCQINGVSTTNPSYGPITVASGNTYYWAVDEVNGPNVWPGAVWSFTYSVKAFNPYPANGAKFIRPNVILSWAAGAGATHHDVYFGTTSPPPFKKRQTETTYDPPGILNYNTTYYWDINEFNGTSVTQGDIWNFKITPFIPITDPNLVGWYKFDSDKDEGDIAADWSGFGNHGQISGGPLYVAGHDANAMQFDGTDDAVVITRKIQSDFTLMAWIKTDTPGPGGTTAREGSGLIWADYAGGGEHFILAVLDTKLAFQTGPIVANTISSRDVVTGDWVHVAVTRTESTGQVELFINGSSDIAGNQNTVPLRGSDNIAIGGNILDSRYYTGLIDDVRIYNRVLTQVEIGQIGTPLIAWLPNPANNDTNVQSNPTLNWMPGKNAAKHDVYLGNDFNDVNNANKTNPLGVLVSPNQVATSYKPGILEFYKTYYWRIDEVNDVCAPYLWKGAVWNFTVGNYLAVDDFESYNPNLAEVWKPGGKATVELSTAPVHEGTKAMSIDYNNTPSPYYSEAYADINGPNSLNFGTNWLAGGVKALSLWLQGIPDLRGSFSYSGTDPLGPYTATITADGNDIWGNADQFHYAYRQLTDTGYIQARVDSVENTHASAKAGVMIRDTLDPGSRYADVVVTPGNGVSFQRRTEPNGNSLSTDVAGVTAPHWVRLTRWWDGSDYYLKAEHANDVSGSCAEDWEQIGEDMLASLSEGWSYEVYIGLCVTSHSYGVMCDANFSNVTFYLLDPPYSQITPDWQSQDIGIPYNDPEPIYVTLQDNDSNATWYYPGTYNPIYADANVTQIGTWTEWNIDLNDFRVQGVNITDVNKIYIGVGDRAPGSGSGTMYVDDIRLYLPRFVSDKLPRIPADLVRNGVVNEEDLGMVTDNWLIRDYNVTPVAPSDANLIAYYAFEDNLLDSAGPPYENGEPCGVPIYVDGQLGKAIQLDGNDAVVTNQSLLNNLPAFTLAGWVSAGNPEASRIGLFGQNDCVEFGFDNGDIHAWANDGSEGIRTAWTLGSTWHHVAAVGDGSGLTIYIDGLLAVSGGNATTSYGTSAYGFNIGGAGIFDASGNWFSGKIDEVRVYGRALSQGEVAYLAGKPAGIPFRQPLYMLLTPPDPNINLYDDAVNDVIDFRDFAELGKSWYQRQVWPIW